MKNSMIHASGCWLILCVCSVRSVTAQETPAATREPLPSWNEGPVRTAILDYVAAVTTKGGPKYVPPAERIATFDNDGTLWCEMPVIQFAFLIHQVKRHAADHPEWKEKPAFEAALRDDMTFLLKDFASGGKGFFEIMDATQTGQTLPEFHASVKEFFTTVKHPRYGVPYQQMRYQPMVELLAYLRANGFRTYICSAGGRDFIRVVSEETFGIVPEKVIGSHGRNKFVQIDGKWTLTKTAYWTLNNNNQGKPEGIDLHIGRVPIFAVGNVRSGGDIPMLTYSQTSKHASFQLLIHHDDAEREFAYTEKNESSLKAARKHHWHVVSMKSDWRTIFSWQQSQQDCE